MLDDISRNKIRENKGNAKKQESEFCWNILLLEQHLFACCHVVNYLN